MTSHRRRTHWESLRHILGITLLIGLHCAMVYFAAIGVIVTMEWFRLP